MFKKSFIKRVLICWPFNHNVMDDNHNSTNYQLPTTNQPITDSMYRDFILDLYRNPLNKKKLANADVRHREFNPSCGDDIAIEIKFNDYKQVIDIGHQGQGCAISQAGVSLLTDHLKSKTASEILEMSRIDMIELLGIPILYTRERCAVIGLIAAQMAIRKL